MSLQAHQAVTLASKSAAERVASSKFVLFVLHRKKPWAQRAQEKWGAWGAEAKDSRLYRKREEGRQGGGVLVRAPPALLKWARGRG